MIKDKSGVSRIGLALLTKNLAKLCPPQAIDLKLQGGRQVIVVTGPSEVFESNSFGWGYDDERSHALSNALAILGANAGVKLTPEMDWGWRTSMPHWVGRARII